MNTYELINKFLTTCMFPSNKIILPPKNLLTTTVCPDIWLSRPKKENYIFSKLDVPLNFMIGLDQAKARRNKQEYNFFICNLGSSGWSTCQDTVEIWSFG